MEVTWDGLDLLAISDAGVPWLEANRHGNLKFKGQFGEITAEVGDTICKNNDGYFYIAHKAQLKII